MPGASNDGLFQYTGQIWLEDAGVYYYKNRTYHAELGVFMQTDPIGQSGGINLHAYVGNDPVNFTDPWGLFEVPTGPIDCDTTNCGSQPDLPDRITVIGTPPYWNQSLAGDDLREFLNNLSPPVVIPDEVITITGTRGGGSEHASEDACSLMASFGSKLAYPFVPGSGSRVAGDLWRQGAAAAASGLNRAGLGGTYGVTADVDVFAPLLPGGTAGGMFFVDTLSGTYGVTGSVGAGTGYNIGGSVGLYGAVGGRQPAGNSIVASAEIGAVARGLGGDVAVHSLADGTTNFDAMSFSLSASLNRFNYNASLSQVRTYTCPL